MLTQVTGIASALESFKFDTIYGHYFDRVIATNGKQILYRVPKSVTLGPFPNVGESDSR